MKKKKAKEKKRKLLIPLYLAISILIIFLAYIIYLQIHEPSNSRDWSHDQAVLAYAKINESGLTLYNIRNFSYTTKSNYTSNYYNNTLDINKLDSLWYIVEPFSNFGGTAHTFLSFGFEEEYIALSVEIRKEKGEVYSPIKGLFNKYELMYVWGNEEDLIQLRSNYRKDEVFLYPVNTTRERAQEVFLDAIRRTNKLKDSPEFYHSITNTCTTSIAKHANEAAPNSIPYFKIGMLFPGYSDKLAYKIGIIDTDLPYEEIRNHFKINKRAMNTSSNIPFSQRIRRFE
jgi:hypothetical protein